MNRLTHKQMSFAEHVAGGCSYSAAYREAYRCKTARSRTIRTEASRLANTPKVAAMIDTLTIEVKELERQRNMTPEEALLEQLRYGETVKERIAAARILGKSLSL
jgi:phage terminase small subunit